MFSLAEDRAFVQVAPSAIAALYHSVNTTSVLVPGRSQAQARAVAVAYRDEAGFRMVIALHLVQSAAHLVYLHDGGVLDGDGARAAAQEAQQFCESMGFFMENLAWRQLDPVAQAELVASLKVFQPPPTSTHASAGTKVVDPRSRLARVLVQF